MTSYVDTILIDCNRKGSEEYKIKKGINEPAIFTCKQGAGIKLNPGDEVSLHSAYINERGNEDNMEFSGKIPKDTNTYELEYTDTIHSRLTTTDQPVSRKTMMARDARWDGPDMREGYGRADCLYYQQDGKGVQQSTSFNRKKTFDVIDNEVNFSISYFKTMNGEGYLSLPRRFDAPNPMRPNSDGYGYGGTASHGAGFLGNSTTAGKPGDVPAWNGPATYPNRVPTPSTAGKTSMPIDKDYWYYLYSAYDGNARILRNGDWVTPTAPDAQGNAYQVDADRQTTWAGANSGTCSAPCEDNNVPRYTDRFLNIGDQGKNKCLSTGQSVGPDCYFTGRCRPILTPEKLVKEDWQFYPHFKYSPTINEDKNPYPQTTDPNTNVRTTNTDLYHKMLMGEVGVGYKHTQDNARMTIYIKQTTFWTKGANNLTKDRAIHLTGTETTATEIEAKNCVDDIFEKDGTNPDPALTTEWLRYKEIKNVKLDTGYNTPDDVAEQITDQLNKTQASTPVKAELLDDAKDPQEISVKQTSECYKPFHSATHHSFGENNDTIVNAFSSTTNNIQDQAMIDWQTAYHHIGVKRPDLWDAGRAIYYDQIMYPGTGTDMASERTFPTIHPNHGITKVGATAGARIVTTIPWTSENVMKYKKLFDAQAQYPELFDYDYCITPGGTAKQEVNVNNSRFLHIDTIQTNTGLLGSDNYENVDGTTDIAKCQTPDNAISYPLFFDYYPEYQDLEYDDDFPVDSIACYGIFTRVNTNGAYTIGFNAYNIKISDKIFQGNTPITSACCIGWDCHFSAYGTKCIMLHTGNLNALYDGKTMLMEKDNNEVETSQRYCNTYPFIKDTYLGANQIELGVEEKGKFYLHQLHTPEYIGNSFASGSSPDNPINPDASDQVYRVNKRLSGDNFCPDMVPYRPTISTETDTANSGKIEISNFNDNLKPFHIYDAMSGVFIENTGIDEDSWDASLWGKLGFSYEQFNSSDTLNRQTRINNLIKVSGIGAITTNADISAGDVPTYPRNAYGGDYYNNSLPNINFPFFENTTDEYGSRVIPSVPAITETQTSVKILADGLPVKMNTPYLLVKSDIVQDTKYYGMGVDNNNYTTGQCLPIVGVVNKENGFGDYYFQTISQMAFTITKPSTLSAITTSIHNPDMSMARLENDSAVIYKVKKNNTGNYNIAGQLIEKGKLKLNP